MGWRRTVQRTCEADDPAILCVDVDPDRPLRVTVGGEAVIPGECVQAPARGGSIKVTVRDGESGREASRRVRARAGRVQTITVREPLKIRLVERERCDRAPFR
ncbi:MAG: hypothetical protein R3B09_22225 [Nannocystaceae bacterium]